MQFGSPAWAMPTMRENRVFTLRLDEGVSRRCWPPEHYADLKRFIQDALLATRSVAQQISKKIRFVGARSTLISTRSRQAKNWVSYLNIELQQN
jgi:hypothetical protein